MSSASGPTSIITQTILGDYGYAHKDTPQLQGRIALVTGGTNGMGLSISRTLYTRGVSVFIVGEDATVGNDAVNYIKSGKLADAPKDYGNGFVGIASTLAPGVKPDDRDYSGDGATSEGSVTFVQSDFESLKDVANTAKLLKGKLDRLDLFLAVAGKGVNEFKRTADGLDSHLSINNLSHHILLSHLFPVLKKTAETPGSDVRIVSMASELHRGTFGPGAEEVDSKFADVEEFKSDIGQARNYNRSKLAVILFTKAITQRHVKEPIVAYCTHPGAVATGQLEQYKPAYGQTVGTVMGAAARLVFRKPDDGALSMLWAAAAKDARDLKYPNGSYFTNPKELGKETAAANDQEVIDNFYNTSEKIIRDVVGAENVGDWVH